MAFPVARDLTRAGHHVQGVDLSPRQIDRARRIVPTAAFVCADMTTYDLGTGRYHAEVALYSLIHLPLTTQPTMIHKIADALVDGVILLATVGWDAWTGTDPDWLATGTPLWWSHTDHTTYRQLNRPCPGRDDARCGHQRACHFVTV